MIAKLLLTFTNAAVTLLQISRKKFSFALRAITLKLVFNIMKLFCNSKVLYFTTCSDLILVIDNSVCVFSSNAIARDLYFCIEF